MNETRRQRMIREARGPEPTVALDATVARVMLAIWLLMAAGFASSLGTHDVPVVNGVSVTTTETTMLQVAALAAATSDAGEQ